MTTEKQNQVRKMPKGGRKGGSVFPRVALSDAIGYSRKLVSKTHTSRQPRDVILSGVLGNKSGIGNIRMSALKQYGFLAGDTKNLYSADDLAKKLAAAPPEDLIPLYRQAALKPTIFRKLFDTFHGDTVSKGRLKQRAADLEVHPDETSTCVELYISSMETAELITLVGDQVKHLALSDLEAPTAPNHENSLDIDESTEHFSKDDVVESGESKSESKTSSDQSSVASAADSFSPPIGPTPRAVFNVNVTLDSSLDIEKLQKQLDLLKRFGAI